MVGMIQILSYLLCFYLVFKGVEIYQIALMSTNEQEKKKGLSIGVAAIIGAVIIAVVFTYMIEAQAQRIGRMNDSLFR